MYEVSHLEKIGVLCKVNHLELWAPAFIIPKKDQTVCFITNFRKLQSKNKRKPYTMPNIQDLLLKLEGFTSATSLNLKMGIYHIKFTQK